MTIFDRIDDWIDAPLSHPTMTSNEKIDKRNLREGFVITLLIIAGLFWLAIMIVLFVVAWKMALLWIGVTAVIILGMVAKAAFTMPPMEEQ